MHPRRTAFALVITLGTLSAQASVNLALEKGCLNCHGTRPRAKAPTVAMLAERYASARGNESEMTRLREHHLLGGVDAHERLSAEDAERFVRWLVEGGR